MRAPYSLIADGVSTDTIECLETLLDRARRGEVIGIAFAAMLRRRAYIVNTAGEAHRNPTFTRGMLAALNDRLGIRVQGGMS